MSVIQASVILLVTFPPDFSVWAPNSFLGPGPRAAVQSGGRCCAGKKPTECLLRLLTRFPAGKLGEAFPEQPVSLWSRDGRSFRGRGFRPFQQNLRRLIGPAGRGCRQIGVLVSLLSPAAVVSHPCRRNSDTLSSLSLCPPSSPPAERCLLSFESSRSPGPRRLGAGRDAAGDGRSSSQTLRVDSEGGPGAA